MAKPRVVLADDHTLVLQACANMLQAEFEVPAIFTNGRALLRAAPALKPDAIVLDIGMPLLNGLDAGRQLKKLLPSAKLIFLTMHEDPGLAAEALRAAAVRDVLRKPRDHFLIFDGVFPKGFHTNMPGHFFEVVVDFPSGCLK